MPDYGGSVISSEELALEKMDAGTARDDTKLPSCRCADPTCPKGHGSKQCGVRMANGCADCNAHAAKKSKK